MHIKNAMKNYRTNKALFKKLSTCVGGFKLNYDQPLPLPG